MIGKPEWFKYRTFGWGIAPRTWQGWVYVAVLAAILGFTMSITITVAAKPWIFAVVFGIAILDIIHIMTKLPKVSDERENYHQLVIERNCSFAAILALIGIALYQTYQNKAQLAASTGIFSLPFDGAILIVLGAMLFTKIVSTLYVRKAM